LLSTEERDGETSLVSQIHQSGNSKSGNPLIRISFVNLTQASHSQTQIVGAIHFFLGPLAFIASFFPPPLPSGIVREEIEIISRDPNRKIKASYLRILPFNFCPKADMTA